MCMGLATARVAELLGVSEATVRRWADAGLLPVQRLGPRRERRFRESDVEAFRNGGGQHPSPLAAAPGYRLGGRDFTRGRHLAAIYSSDEGRLRLSVSLLRQAVGERAQALLIAPDDIADQVLAALRDEVGDLLETASLSGRLITASSIGTTIPAALGFWEERLWSALNQDLTVVAVADMNAPLRSLGSESRVIEFEHALDGLLRRFQPIVLCQYDSRVQTGTGLLEALKSHPDLLEVPISGFLV
jgi:transcriptional repressor of dcmA and dcmR